MGTVANILTSAAVGSGLNNCITKSRQKAKDKRQIQEPRVKNQRREYTRINNNELLDPSTSSGHALWLLRSLRSKSKRTLIYANRRLRQYKNQIRVTRQKAKVHRKW